MNDAGWESTRHGGVRRTRVAQQRGKARDNVLEARAEASADVKGAPDRDKYLVEHLLNRERVGGSNPSPRTSKWLFKAKEQLGLPSCPYLIRWRLETPWGSIRLHHWLAPDDDRAPHDHPWSFRTFVLKGGYTDESPSGTQHLKAPATQWRSAEHQHTVYPGPGGCWTIIVTGPKTRNWGFWVKGKFVKMNKYFLTYGHHPCN